MSSHFYLTLPSNSSEKYYGKQPLNHFKTRLPYPLNLDVNEWEVGLAEIIYPYTWKNLRSTSEVCIGISSLELDPDTGLYPIHELSFTMQISHYMSVKDLVNKINTRIDNTLKKMKRETMPDNKNGYLYYYGVKGKYVKTAFRYDENVGKVYLSGNNHIFLILPAGVAQMLGFGDKNTLIGSESLCQQVSNHICHYSDINCNTFKYEDEQGEDSGVKLLKAEYDADVHRGLTSLYVYSPIVESQFVGDTQAPLLRVIPVAGEFGETVNVRYDQIYYMSLAQSFIEHVDVYIRDDVGEYVAFDTGRVTIVLHFRKKTI